MTIIGFILGKLVFTLFVDSNDNDNNLTTAVILPENHSINLKQTVMHNDANVQ